MGSFNLALILISLIAIVLFFVLRISSRPKKSKPWNTFDFSKMPNSSFASRKKKDPV